MHACSPEGTRVLFHKHLWGQVPQSHWKFVVTGNELQAPYKGKQRALGEPGQRCSPEPVTARWLRGHPQRFCTCGATGKKYGRYSYKRRIKVCCIKVCCLSFPELLHWNITVKFIQYPLEIINQTPLEKQVGWKRGGMDTSVNETTPPACAVMAAA